jgi:hypothetical protein
MARKPIDIGTIGNDGTGDSIRDAFRKVNDNFRELYSSLGLGDRLTFIGLDDTPLSYDGQENSVLTVNSTTDGLAFRKIENGTGILIDYTTDPNAITINSLFADISGDPAPNLGGPLNAQFGELRSPIGNIVDLSNIGELNTAKLAMQNVHGPFSANTDRLAANKGYVDNKISLSGIDSIDPATGTIDTSFGRMTGPLVLSRDPIPEDDLTWNGQVAATKRYVDNSGFGSTVNLYVATSGLDDRPSFNKSLQGRALPFAYKTIEAALKRAEELVLEAPIEVGPYKKILTFNNGAGECFLKSVGAVEGAGSGFSGQLFMSVDGFVINNRGSLYLPGEVITVSGGTGTAAIFEVLSVTVVPGTGGRGQVSALKLISTGVYSALPGSTNVSTLPPGSGSFGSGLTVDLTYNVNRINVLDGGSGYGLVSVRIVGGGGNGAFGTADVVSGSIFGITVTNKGSGFTSLPNVVVNLPRFFIETFGFRTDFTGNIVSSTPQTIRSRDIREGLLLRGETSGAIAQILSHRGELSTESDTLGCEIFDVDLLSGGFQEGEVISYGDVTKNVQISVFVESGVYEENYPLRIPQNVAIIGDEFRRVIIKPKTAVFGAPMSGMSSSPWASLYFRRDTVIDDMTVAEQLYGYHYLSDPTEPVYPLISNRGFRRSSAQLLELNREFIKTQVIGWINNQILTATSGSTFDGFVYNQDLCQRDIGLLVDAMVFDLKYGGYSRTVSAALKYYASVSSLIAIEEQLSQTEAGIQRINTLAQQIILNTQIDTLYTATGTSFQLSDINNTLRPVLNQIIDPAFVSESGSGTIISELIDAVIDIISNSGAANYPKDNNQLDVFLCNDANIIRAVTCQGHGGFMMVLDPEGQILTKSPYCQESAAFSRSTGRKTFAGGMFVDGFTGNQQFRITAAPEYSPGLSNILEVDGFLRIPNTPCSFIVEDTIYRVNYIRNYNYSVENTTPGPDQWYSSAQLILDETTPWPFGVIEDNLYEILMPGNRSMLSNDFTQVNDLGYGLVVANGGLTEAVSMFTYYCQISYYALTGGQIRSIGGSSSHGNYALVAEGSDPLEVPTPVRLYHQLSQGATVVANSISTTNIRGGTTLFVIYDDYFPLSSSELEINHNNLFTRYAISGVTLADSINKIARLTISSSSGLEAAVPNGQRITIRQNSFVVLTGDVVDVATRPSTALVLSESNTVYRILDFNNYNSTFDKDVFTITNINLVSGIITTNVPHRQLAGYQIKIRKESTDVLPSAILAQTLIPAVEGNVYYIKDVIDSTRFTIAVSKLGSRLDMSAGPAYSGSLTAKVIPFGLTLTQLRENYSYVTFDLYQTQPFRTPSSLISCTFSVATPTVVTSTSHGLTPGSQIRFNASGGSLPAGIDNGANYWVVSKDLNLNNFKITTIPPIYSNQIGISGSINETTISGLVSTSQLIPGMRLIARASIPIVSVTGNGTTATITFAQRLQPPFLSGQLVNIAGIGTAGFNNPTATVISCTTTTLTYLNSTSGTSTGGTISVITTGSLGTNPTISSIPSATSIVITSSGGESNGTVIFDVEGAEIGVSSAGSNVGYGKLIGDQGQTTIAVSDLNPLQELRVINSRLVYEGQEYTVLNYQERPNSELYSLITLDKPLVNSAIHFSSAISLKAGVDAKSSGAEGTLTIRIALVRVTSHDFLEIGTGSYADTNYPNDIFGPAVNDFNSVPVYATDFDATAGAGVTRAQVQERDVGRAFFVTTDQYGNFSVGPFFRVDQGTGTITFSASIAISQLDGLGFKRGATISEFSIDDSLADGSNDAVPTEAAVRGYIDRRLGVSFNGASVSSSNLIPVGNAGGFMSLTGQLAMKGIMDLGDFKIQKVGPPTNGTDAARLQDINLVNLKDTDGGDLFTFTEIQSGQLLALTGDRNTIGNFTPTGDVTFDITSGANIIRTIISPGVISNASVNASAGILQSKLSLTSASTRVDAVGITQAERGIVSFDSGQFTLTSGWATIKDNGLLLSKLAQIGTRRVLGNPSSTVTANITSIPYTDIVSDGGAIKKSQFSDGVGYLRRTNATAGAFTNDEHYSIVNDDSNSTANTLVRRDANRDFAGRQVTVNEIKLTTTSTGTYTGIRSNELTTTSGFTELFGYGGGGGSVFVGIGIGAGGAAANNKTNYNNTTHEFRNQNGTTVFATLDNTGVNIGTRTVVATGLSSGASGTAIGTITGYWQLAAGSRMQATYAADLAEYYEGDQEYEVGTVLIFGGDKEVTVSTRLGDARIAGVISDNAAYSMNGACPGFKNQIALQGRVPCKVVGKVSKGDMLITSDIPGVAVAATGDVKVGTVIGKSLGTYDSEEVGIVEVSVGRT